MDFFSLLIGAAGYLFAVFTALAYACGLFYLAELAEDYPTITKECLRWGIIVVTFLHLLCFIFEEFPYHCLLLGIAFHVCSYQLLHTFPDCALLSPQAISSFVLLIVSNLAWCYFFIYSYFMISEILAFYFLMVWLIPVAFFISLSFGDGVLPMKDVDTGKKQKKSSSLKMLCDLFGRKKSSANRDWSGDSKASSSQDFMTHNQDTSYPFPAPSFPQSPPSFTQSSLSSFPQASSSLLIESNHSFSAPSFPQSSFPPSAPSSFQSPLRQGRGQDSSSPPPFQDLSASTFQEAPQESSHENSYSQTAYQGNNNSGYNSFGMRPSFRQRAL